MSSTMSTSTTTPYLNNASKILPVRVDCTSTTCIDRREEGLIRVVTELCPFMSSNGANADNNAFSISQLSGGLSNVMFVVKHGDNEVLVRIQSNSESALVNLEEENCILAWLSSESKAPTFYGRFLNGRVEEFYSGYVPLKYSEMQLYQTQIATLLASLHNSTPPTSVLPPPSNNNGGGCWTTIQSWLNLAKTLQSKQHDESLNLDHLQAEFDWLQRQLNTTTSHETNSAVQQYCRQVVFCHMDAQSLNLLKNNNNNNLKLIDYEYAGWNPRAADIANTFCEYCDMNNLRADYKTQYPTPRQQDLFLKAYLKHAMGDDDDEKFTDYPEFHLEIGKHALISHLQWTVWSLVQNSLSDIRFDYIAYARQRMEGYELFKQKYYTTEEINS